MNPRPLENKPRGKCRKWELRVSCGLNPKTGKYVEHTRRFEGTYSSAVAATESFAAEMSTIKPSEQFLGTFAHTSDLWITQRLSMRLIAVSTAKKQHYQLKAISAHLGKMPLAKIKTAHINNAIAAMMSGDCASGKKLSGTYAAQILTTTRAMFDWAMNQGYILNNPAAKALMPKQDTQERPVLTEQQINALIDATPPSCGYHVAVRLALMAGLRFSEVLNLKWSEVDFRQCKIKVPGTKTTASKATVPVSPALIDYLLSWSVQQAAESTLKDTQDVFVVGVNKEALKTWWRRKRENLGLGNVHFHDLRHGFATTLARNGTHPKAIQLLMRHKDERMAMKVYTHFANEDLREAVNQLF